MSDGIEYEIDEDVPDGFNPDDLDADMFEDYPDVDPAKGLTADD